jgi:BolA family transcriptional regulator, general stress-responsive regulator
MGTAEIIRERLAPLCPESMEVFDESAEHVGHPGAREGGGHYQLVIVSPRFSGHSSVARHRMVYQALGDLIPGRIHALAIRAYAPEEMGFSVES